MPSRLPLIISLLLLLVVHPRNTGGNFIDDVRRSIWGSNIWLQDDKTQEAPCPVCLIKIGGSALTDKSVLEKLKTSNLDSFCHQLVTITQNSPSAKFIVVHGAGSFGHMQARKFNLSAGGGADWQEGLRATHRSVSKLNSLVLEALHRRDLVSALLVPIFPTVVTRGREEVVFGGPLLDPGQISGLLRRGLVPVLHGDTVLDDTQNCTIFSGDRILLELATAFNAPSNVPSAKSGQGSEFRISSCVFLTDVAGVFDKPPEQRNARLIRKISVGRDGAIKGMEYAGGDRPGTPGGITAIDTATRAGVVDVTGGICGKIEAACKIAALADVPVVIVEIGTMDALDAMSGRVPERCTLIVKE